jgi:hydrophobe/amphiphile efflux-3 (HAE3) family protein
MDDSGPARVMRSCVRGVVRGRVIVIVVLACISVYLSSHIGQLKVDVDTPRFLPQDHPYVVAQNELERVFGGRDIVVIGVIPREGDIYQPAVLAKVARITERVASVPGVVRSNLLSLAARRAKAVRATADGMEVQPLLPGPATPDTVSRLRASLAQDPLFRNAVVSPDDRAAQIVADFRVGNEMPDYPTLERTIRAITDPEEDAQTHIPVGGLPIALSWMARYSERMAWVFPIAVLVIGALHYHAFRTLQGFFIPLLTALLSVVWALGIMGLLRVPIDPFSASTPVLVLAIAAGHSVQILKRYYEELARVRDNHSAVIESTARIGLVMVTAGLTSAAGFFSLLVFKTQAMRTFGIFTGIGILSALVIEMTLIPAVRAALPSPGEFERRRERTLGRLDDWLERLAKSLTRLNPRHVLLGAGLVAAVAAVGVRQVRVDNGMKKWYFAHTRLIQDDRALNERFGGTNTLNFLIDGGAPDAIKEPRLLDAIDRLQRFLEADPGIGKTLSFVDHVKRMNQAMHADEPEAYRVSATAELVAQYLLLYSMAGDPGDFDTYVDSEYRLANLQVFSRVDSTAYTRDLLRRAEAFVRASFPPGVRVHPSGTMAYTLALNETMAKGKILNILQIAGIIFAISALLFRSLIGGGLVILPLALTVLLNFALLGFSGTSLDIPTAAIMGVAVGLGADFAIYFLFRFREELARTGDAAKSTFMTMTSSGKAITYVSTAVSLGYLVLMTSGFGIHMRMALLMASAVAFSCLATLVLLPPILLLARPRFIFRRGAGVGSPTVEDREIAVVGRALPLVIGIVLLRPAVAATEPPSEHEIMRRSYLVSRVKDARSEATITLINEGGHQRVRRLASLTRLNDDGLTQMRLARFVFPPDVKGTATLMIEHPEGDDDMWVYLPALGKVRRLTGRNKSESYVGTDFSYGDILGHKVEDSTHRLLGSESLDAVECYMVESVPVSEKVRRESGYSRRVSWVRKDNFVAVKIEGYDLQDRLLKRYTASELRLVDPSSGRWQPMRMEMANLQTGHRTVLAYQEFKANAGIPVTIFTTRSLEKEF